MALIVETGDGLTDAEAYISVADADTYHADYGNTDWSEAATADREIAIRKATQWIDGHYRRQFIGSPETITQSLEWPRRDTYIDGIPMRLRHATAEAALLIVQGEDLTPALERGGRVTRQAIGEIELEYSKNAPPETVYTVVENLLSGLVQPSGHVTLRRG